MSTELLLFTISYILVSFGVVYPPIEFLSAGFTIETIFAKFLGSETEQFIQYHIRRSTLTLFIHSILPFGYVFCLMLFYGTEQVSLLWNNTNPYLLQLFTTTCFILPLLALYKINIWSKNNWQNHPICSNLKKFSTLNWMNIASDINIEYRRIDKICIHTNSIIKILATDNWLLKITPYTIYCAHQSDTALIVCSSDTHNLSVANRGEVQYINIEVKSTRPNVKPFFIRLNALDFKDLQDKWSRPITVLSNVNFHKTLIDRFIDAFKEQIELNQTYETNQELDSCIGCMQTTANVKIQKLCVDDSNEIAEPGQACVNCYCRPMWCVECMARWFASRQDETTPENWLASKCTCPVCRAKFCVYDVSIIQPLRDPIN